MAAADSAAIVNDQSPTAATTAVNRRARPPLPLPRWLMKTPLAEPTPTARRPSPHAVVQIDRIVHGHGLAVLRRGLEFPAAGGVHRGHVQPRDATLDLEVRDASGRVDRQFEEDAALNPLVLRFR